MKTPIQLSSGTILNVSEIENAKEAVYKAIKNELPEEDHFYEAIAFILRECEEELQTKRVIL